MPATPAACPRRVPHVGQVAHEGVVLRGQGAHKGVGGTGVDPPQGAVGGRRQLRQLGQLHHPLRSAGVGGLQHRVGLVDGPGADRGHLPGGRGQILDRTQLPPDHGNDVERRQDGRVQQAVGRVEFLLRGAQGHGGGPAHDVGRGEMGSGLVHVRHPVTGVHQAQGDDDAGDGQPQHHHHHDAPHDASPPGPPSGACTARR